MGRLKFAESNLAVLQPLLEHPLAKETLAKAIPVKRLGRDATVHRDDVPAPSTFKLATRDSPDGVPLHALLDYGRGRVPTVNSLSFVNGRLSVGYSKPPDGATRAAVDTALKDRPALGTIAARFAAPTDLATMRQRLLDSSLSDAEWLRAFRQVQVATMGASPPPTPSPTPTPLPRPE